LGIARAQVLGLTTRIRPAVTMVCKLCGGQFADQSLPASVVERFGIDRLVFCAPCINATLFFDGLPTPSRNDILSFVRALTDLAGRVPPQGLGTGVSDLVGLDDEARERILRLLKTSPSKLAIDRNYGSWFDALVEAGVLEDGARRNSRGIQCQAKDGHVCFSLGEKTIDDLLCSMGVAHIKEPMYPASKFRADFEVDGVFIEYFGLSGDPEYDKKTEAKLALAQKHGIQLIALYPRDLASMSELSKKLSALHCRDIDTPRSSL
jgi:hypothetical protein